MHDHYLATINLFVASLAEYKNRIYLYTSQFHLDLIWCIILPLTAIKKSHVL